MATTRFRTLVFSLTPVLVLLVILEVTGRIVYPFDPDERARIRAERDPRIRLSYFSREVDGRRILSDAFRVEKRYLPFLGFLGAPNRNYGTVWTNALGFRDDPLARRQANEFRVLVLGGSFAWGLGASSNQATLSGALERLLNQGQGGKRFRVMNGAFFSYTARQESIVLTEFLEELDPDLIISVTGYNDISTMLFGSEKFLQRPEARALAKAVDENLRPMGTLRALRKVAGSLGIWRLVIHFRELRQLRNPPGQPMHYDPDRAQRLVRRVVDIHQTMAEYATRHGRKYVIALQPDIYSTGKALTPEETQTKERSTKRNQGLAEAFSKYRRDLATGLTEMERRGVQVVDLKTAFDQTKQPLFLDDCHVVDPAYRMVAETLMRSVANPIR